MSDLSHRRRWAGRSLLLAGALALPLTASISYAEATQELPATPLAPSAPEAPEAPVPAEAPEAPETFAWSSEDGDFEIAFGDGEDDGEVIKRKVIIGGDGAGEDGENVFVIKTKDRDGNVKVERHVKKVHFKSRDGRELSEEEIEKLEQRIEKKMMLREKEMEKLGERIEHRMEMRFGQGATARMVKMDCDSDGQASNVRTDDGGVAIAICAEGIAKEALKQVRASLKDVRKMIAKDLDLTDEQRAEALKELDAEIARMDKTT